VGEGNVAVIDPGPDDPEHLKALRAALEGETVTHILVTHTHNDHSPAAKHLKAWSDAPTYGYGPHGSGAAEKGIAVEEGGDMEFVPDEAVRDGDIVTGHGFSFDCVHTPGHTSNHVCFGFREHKALFTGDHVMGWSTSVIAPPDGDMTDYLASLEKLLARDDAIYWPTHGNAIREPRVLVAGFIAHRREREAQILAALEVGLHRIEDIVPRVYAGLDPKLFAAAGRSALAHLLRLEQLGLVRRGEEGSTATFLPVSRA
jgi:glyoxylase-like metal-dependent hydrolase (beta-lactamase superfamily II)